ncbi:MAG: helix-turn-helix transcriptional regulator [Victivallales bacterium]|jgi:AraC-like DNA-binding protein
MNEKKINWNRILEQAPRLSFINRTRRSTGKSPEYYLPDLWSVILCTFNADVQLNGQHFSVRPGFVCVMPPGIRRSFIFAGRSLHRCFHFHLPENKVRLPFVINADNRFFELERLFDDALRFFPVNRSRAESLIWQLLWLISDIAPSLDKKNVNPALSAAIEYIGEELGGELKVAAIAHTFGISQNHLARLFKKALGITPASYIRKRRMELASSLLRETDMPIKSVAVDVGIPDPHHFNKCFRHEFGRSPSALRQGNPELHPQSPYQISRASLQGSS